jgi:hypothetical protein
MEVRHLTSCPTAARDGFRQSGGHTGQGMGSQAHTSLAYRSFLFIGRQHGSAGAVGSGPSVFYLRQGPPSGRDLESCGHRRLQQTPQPEGSLFVAAIQSSGARPAPRAVRWTMARKSRASWDGWSEPWHFPSA